MNIYICSPCSDQGRSIISLVKNYRPETKICGVLLAGERASILKKIDRFLYIHDIDLSKIPGQMLPTGAKSTEFCLKRGDVSFGHVVLKREALKVFDKPWILQQADNSGVPIPQTWYEISQIEKYPVFFKARYEKGCGDRGLAHSVEDIPRANKESLIFQEYIDSPGTYGVGFIARDGKIIASHGHFERESQPSAGGSAVIIENFNDLRLANHTAKLLSKLNYSGWGLAEFKYCLKRNDYVFMEINAKFWASCALAFANEPNFAKLLFNIDKPNEKIKQVFYMNRALRRGPLFFLKNMQYMKNSKIITYPGIMSSFLSGIMPIFLLAAMRSINNQRLC